MPGHHASVDPDGLLEYSVVFTDRSLNHMSSTFQTVMNDISSTLKQVYNASALAIVPGGGTYAMEAVARQLATNRSCLVIRNGWFSFRWSQIFDVGSIPAKTTVLQAKPVDTGPTTPFAPPSIEDVVATIRAEEPDLVFAPHVETASGMLLPDDYLRAVGAAVHDVGGLFVLDCVASGALWVDMVDCGVDVLISAPQKGWSGSPSAGLVALSPRAKTRVAESSSTSFACNLGTWLSVMEAYENGGHAYHATMPTDALRGFRDVMIETRDFGLAEAKSRQLELGDRVRSLLVGRGFPSVAAVGYQAPGVVVSYTDDPEIHNGRKFASVGVQIAAGVPLRCGEPEGFRTFRLGLFGLDKLANVDRTVETLADALTALAET